MDTPIWELTCEKQVPFGNDEPAYTIDLFWNREDARRALGEHVAEKLRDNVNYKHTIISEIRVWVGPYLFSVERRLIRGSPLTALAAQAE